MSIPKLETKRATPRPRRSYHDFVPAPLRPYTIALGRTLRDLEYRGMNLVSRVNPSPLFVLGNQKSGTTAIAALLARGAGKSVTLDLTREVWNPTFHKIPSGELSFDDFVARHRWGFSREVVKEPNLTLFYPELARTFPDASFLFVVRDPRDNIRSILNRLKIPGDLDFLPDDAVRSNPLASPGWRFVFDGSWRGIPGEHYIDRLAHRWRYCFEVYWEHAAEIHLCRYEDFVADKIGTLARTAQALGCSIDTDVNDQLDYPFQPPGDNSLAWSDFFGVENQARIEAICSEGMREMNYPLATPGAGA